MQDTFSHFKPKKTVLQRTRPQAGLPKICLYVERHAGQHKCKVVDTEGAEHLLDDVVMQSSYKLVTGKKAHELIDEHWKKLAD